MLKHGEKADFLPENNFLRVREVTSVIQYDNTEQMCEIALTNNLFFILEAFIAIFIEFFYKCLQIV